MRLERRVGVQEALLVHLLEREIVGLFDIHVRFSRYYHLSAGWLPLHTTRPLDVANSSS